MNHKTINLLYILIYVLISILAGILSFGLNIILQGDPLPESYLRHFTIFRTFIESTGTYINFSIINTLPNDFLHIQTGLYDPVKLVLYGVFRIFPNFNAFTLYLLYLIILWLISSLIALFGIRKLEYFLIKNNTKMSYLVSIVYIVILSPNLKNPTTYTIITFLPLYLFTIIVFIDNLFNSKKIYYQENIINILLMNAILLLLSPYHFFNYWLTSIFIFFISILLIKYLILIKKFDLIKFNYTKKLNLTVLLLSAFSYILLKNESTYNIYIFITIVFTFHFIYSILKTPCEFGLINKTFIYMIGNITIIIYILYLVLISPLILKKMVSDESVYQINQYLNLKLNEISRLLIIFLSTCIYSIFIINNKTGIYNLLLKINRLVGLVNLKKLYSILKNKNLIVLILSSLSIYCLYLFISLSFLKFDSSRISTYTIGGYFLKDIYLADGGFLSFIKATLFGIGTDNINWWRYNSYIGFSIISLIFIGLFYSFKKYGFNVRNFVLITFIAYTLVVFANSNIPFYLNPVHVINGIYNPFSLFNRSWHFILMGFSHVFLLPAFIVGLNALSDSFKHRTLFLLVVYASTITSVISLYQYIYKPIIFLMLITIFLLIINGKRLLIIVFIGIFSNLTMAVLINQKIALVDNEYISEIGTKRLISPFPSRILSSDNSFISQMDGEHKFDRGQDGLGIANLGITDISRFAAINSTEYLPIPKSSNEINYFSIGRFGTNNNSKSFLLVLVPANLISERAQRNSVINMNKLSDYLRDYKNYSIESICSLDGKCVRLVNGKDNLIHTINSEYFYVLIKLKSKIDIIIENKIFYGQILSIDPKINQEIEFFDTLPKVFKFNYKKIYPDGLSELSNSGILSLKLGDKIHIYSIFWTVSSLFITYIVFLQFFLVCMVIYRINKVK